MKPRDTRHVEDTHELGPTVTRDELWLRSRVGFA